MFFALLIAAATTPTSAAPPNVEAEALGRRLAATGALQTLLPAMGAKETEELVVQHHELGPDEQARLRVVASVTLAADSARLAAAIGHQFALALSLEDLRVLVAFNEGPLGQRYRAVLPQVTFQGLATLGKLDFKGDVLKAFCAETGKLCAR